MIPTPLLTARSRTRPYTQDVVYLASPYSHPVSDVEDARYEAALRACAVYAERGEHVFSPIAHAHPVARAADLPGDSDYWRRWNQAFLDRANRLDVLTLPRWQDSKGVAWEIAYAEEFAIPITYLCPYELGVLSWA